MPLTAVRAYAAGRKDTGARGMGPSAPAWDGRTGRPKLPPAAKAKPGTPREPDPPAGVAAFARLAALVPPGAWPVTLPTATGQPVRPLQVGIRQRVLALLPEGEHQALRGALRRHVEGRAYREAVAVEGAMRWSDAGEPLGPVSADHREHALSRLRARCGS